MEFTRQNLRQIRADLVLALSKVEQAHGIKLEVGNIRFSPDSFRCRLEAKSGASTGTSRTCDRDEQAKKDFGYFAVGLGLKKEDFGLTFTLNRTAYTICGLKPRSFKFPVLAKSVRGTTYKFTVAQVLEGLGRHKEATAARLREVSSREVDPELLAARRGLV